MNTNKTDKCKFISIIAQESSAQLHCFRSWNLPCKMCVLVDDSEYQHHFPSPIAPPHRPAFYSSYFLKLVLKKLIMFSQATSQNKKAHITDTENGTKKE